MPQERLTMRKIKEILRLKHEAGLSNRAISGACKISNSTVGEYLRRAEAAGVGWPLGELSEDELYQKIFGEPTPIYFIDLAGWIAPGFLNVLPNGVSSDKHRAVPDTYFSRF